LSYGLEQHKKKEKQILKDWIGQSLILELEDVLEDILEFKIFLIWRFLNWE